jgi:hypothetical protein
VLLQPQARPKQVTIADETYDRFGGDSSRLSVQPGMRRAFSLALACGALLPIGR